RSAFMASCGSMWIMSRSSFGPGLVLLRRFGLVFFVICYYRITLILVPEPGIGPGRLVRARGCKPRLSASSSTRGPLAKGPHNAALSKSSKRNFVELLIVRWSSPKDAPHIIFYLGDFPISSQP